jgi:uncharacterized protein YkwD
MSNAVHIARGCLIAALIFFICSVPGLSTNAVRAADDFSRLEQDVFDEINQARTNPGSYLSYLKDLRRLYAGKQIRLSGNYVINTREGIPAVDEAVQYLQDTSSMPSLEWSNGMSLGAMDHVAEQGPAGETGHRSGDGRHPLDRMNHYGEGQGMIAENIAYGRLPARMMVLAFIIDDGIPDRGHRKNLFNPELRYAGVACGDHKQFGIMCVIDFAGEYVETGGDRP